MTKTNERGGGPGREPVRPPFHWFRHRNFRGPFYRALIEAQGGLCAYCLGPVVLTPGRGVLGVGSAPNEATFDHVVPRKGGPSRLHNVVVACLACNNQKADSTWTVRNPAVSSRRKREAFLRRAGYYR